MHALSTKFICDYTDNRRIYHVLKHFEFNCQVQWKCTTNCAAYSVHIRLICIRWTHFTYTIFSIEWTADGDAIKWYFFWKFRFFANFLNINIKVMPKPILRLKNLVKVKSNSQMYPQILRRSLYYKCFNVSNSIIIIIINSSSEAIHIHRIKNVRFAFIWKNGL